MPADLEVAVRAAEEAEELVEAALLRVHFRQRAEVPLADQAGGVAGGLEPVGEGRLGQRQALAAAGIELVAEAGLVAAGQQPGARRRAIRPGHVAVGEPHAGGGQRVEVRRGDVLAAVEAHVGIAHVVADDEQDVGFLGLGSQAGSKHREACEDGRECRSNASMGTTWDACPVRTYKGCVHDDRPRLFWVHSASRNQTFLMPSVPAWPSVLSEGRQSSTDGKAGARMTASRYPRRKTRNRAIVI